MLSISDLGSIQVPKTETLFKKPGTISAFFLNIPFRPVFATFSEVMLNFSANSAKESIPARLENPVAVGPGHKQLTLTGLSFSSYRKARL